MFFKKSVALHFGPDSELVHTLWRITLTSQYKWPQSEVWNVHPSTNCVYSLGRRLQV